MNNIPYSYVFILIISSAIYGCGAASQDSDPTVDVFPGSSRLSDLLSDGGMAGYAKATQPREFQFPADHGPHPEFRNEWWYVTGNLDGDSGERFGFELTFFRFSLVPDNESTTDSSWQTNQVYVAHFAVTDVGANTFHVSQRYSRGSAGLSGATTGPLRLWLDDWSIEEDEISNRWHLQAHDNDFGLDLEMLPLKQPILNGVDGLSQKSADPGNASYYYSIPRLQSDGMLTTSGKTFAVSGLAWLDREWSSSALSKEQRGWDWFALQLSDGSELMFYQLRMNDSSIDVHSAGTWIDAGGAGRQLAHDDVAMTVTGYWRNEQGDRYPAAWDISVASLSLQLHVTPIMSNQELVTNVRYWEGAVDVTGLMSGAPIVGRGYVELTGYAEN